MKNKKIIYVLLPAVVFIWGMIIYKVSAGSSPDDVNGVSSLAVEYEQTSQMKDTFSLLGSYRDPFQMQVAKVQMPTTALNAQSAISVHKEKLSSNIPAEKTWPSLAYSGVIKNQKSQKELAMVQIDGQNNLMRSGDVIANVQLVKVFRDSIQVKFGKEKKTIRK